MERCIKSLNEFAAQLPKKGRKKQTSCYAFSHHFNMIYLTFSRILFPKLCSYETTMKFWDLLVYIFLVSRCRRGEYFDVFLNQCMNCSRGTYQPNKSENFCFRCPGNTTTLFRGATDISQCIGKLLLSTAKQSSVTWTVASWGPRLIVNSMYALS